MTWLHSLSGQALQDAAARDEEVEGDGAQDVPEGGLEVTRDFCFSMSEDTGPGD